MSKKLIVSNDGALQRKYGQGTTAIKVAITAWIARDSARGLNSEYVAIDDQAKLAQWHIPPVPRWSDQQQVKRVIDALWNAVDPDYLVILGGPDVIPHQDLKNPISSDPDGAVPSDLRHTLPHQRMAMTSETSLGRPESSLGYQTLQMTRTHKILFT